MGEVNVWRVDTSGALLGRFDGHIRVDGHLLVITAGIVVVWAIVKPAIEPVETGVFAVGFDG